MDLSRFVRGVDAPPSPTKPKDFTNRRVIASQIKLAPRGRFTPNPNHTSRPSSQSRNVDSASYGDHDMFDSTIHSDFDASTVNGDFDDVKTDSDVTEHAEEPAEPPPAHDYAMTTVDPNLSRIRQQFDMFQAGSLQYSSQVPPYKQPSSRFTGFQWPATQENGSHDPNTSQDGPKYSSPPEPEQKHDDPEPREAFGDGSDDDVLSESSRSSSKTEAGRKHPMDGFKPGNKGMDYDADALTGMAYDDLVAEPFDRNPKTDQVVALAARQAPSRTAGSVPDRMATFLHEDVHHQQAMLALLSLHEWEQAGDWFLDRFADVLSCLKEARRAKRDVAARFETHVAEREAAVRAKKMAYDQLLRNMRMGGEEVLRGTPRK